MSLVLPTFVLLVISGVVLATPPRRSVRQADKYTTRYDSVDVDRILQSKRLLLSYVNCLLDKGPCTAEGRELRKYIPDALSSECSKCSDIQKKQAGKVFSELLLNHRNYWDQLIAKYDPDGNFRKKYEDAIDEDYSEYDDASADDR